MNEQRKLRIISLVCGKPINKLLEHSNPLPRNYKQRIKLTLDKELKKMAWRENLWRIKRGYWRY